MGVGGHRHSPDALYPLEMAMEAAWASELDWTQRLEEKILFLCRGSNPGRLVCSQTLTELPQPHPTYA
jgi:hypothetical protein